MKYKCTMLCNVSVFRLDDQNLLSGYTIIIIIKSALRMIRYVLKYILHSKIIEVPIYVQTIDSNCYNRYQSLIYKYSCIGLCKYLIYTHAHCLIGL